MQIAAVQMVSGFDLSENLQQAQILVEQAAAAGAELVVLPEMFAVFGGGDQYKIGLQESTPEGAIRCFLSTLAAANNIYLVAGTIPTTAASNCGRNPELQDRVYAACFCYNCDGEEIARYDKSHLFDADVVDQQGRYRESDTFAAGNFAGVMPSPWGNIGIGVCYDLRFPEYFRRLSEADCQIVVLPAAFTYATGEAHWRLLLQARAVENLCYMVAAAQGGQHSSKRRSWGHSCIISPWGKVQQELEQGPGWVMDSIDFTQQAQYRQQLPVLRHRRNL